MRESSNIEQQTSPAAAVHPPFLINNIQCGQIRYMQHKLHLKKPEGHIKLSEGVS